jgi:hypothetical protein
MEEASRTYTKEIRGDQFTQELIKLIKMSWLRWLRLVPSGTSVPRQSHVIRLTFLSWKVP